MMPPVLALVQRPDECFELLQDGPACRNPSAAAVHPRPRFGMLPLAQFLSSSNQSSTLYFVR